LVRDSGEAIMKKNSMLIFFLFLLIFFSGFFCGFFVKEQELSKTIGVLNERIFVNSAFMSTNLAMMVDDVNDLFDSSDERKEKKLYLYVLLAIEIDNLAFSSRTSEKYTEEACYVYNRVFKLLSKEEDVVDIFGEPLGTVLTPLSYCETYSKSE
jgi:hypothetical protein